jgi:tagatose 6-phosphate kinase
MIVCLGTTPVYQRSMVFERLRLNEVNRATVVHDYASGKSINVARVLHTLGQDVIATGFVGSGERGDALLADLDRAGVRHDFVRVRPPARQCATVIDREAGTATELVEESQPVGDDPWKDLEQKLLGFVATADGFVFSGSLPPGAAERAYADLLRLIEHHARPVPVILDTRRGPLLEALVVPRAHVRLVAKLNREELAETVGAPVGTDERLRAAMQKLTPARGCLVVTAGADGLFVRDGETDGSWRVRPPGVAAKSAVGSGDAFAAGMMIALLRGDSLADACALGAACGAANALTDLAGFLSPADVESLLPRVHVEAL